MKKNIYILDLESRPNPKLVNIFMADKIDKAEKTLKKDLAKAETFKQEATIEKKKAEAMAKYEKAIDPENSRKAMSVSTHFSEVVCIGVKEVDGTFHEALTLKAFAEWLESRYNKAKEEHFGSDKSTTGVAERELANGEVNFMTLISYNGRNFDVPVLVNQFMKQPELLSSNIVDQLFYSENKYRGRSQAIKHIDLADMMNRGGDKMNFMKLDTALQIYCGTKKNTMGDEFFKNATDGDLIKHCLEDISFTEQLYKVFYK